MSDIPADVLFAQKASAVAKCAGVDPRALDLEEFRSSCPIIFSRAFCTIYREREGLPYDVEENPERCMQYVIEELAKKTGVSVLREITGVHVCAGSHRAIGILVGVLFAEGQRAWLAKQEKKKREDQRKRPLVQRVQAAAKRARNVNLLTVAQTRQLQALLQKMEGSGS